MPIKKIAYTILAALFIALFAQIEIELPLNQAGISITGQTFAILLAAFFLGRWHALLAVAIYIGLGAIGLPVFAGGESGLEKLYGGSAGFLGGFLIAAFAVGAFGEKGWRKSLAKCLLAMLIGTLIIVAFGVLRLTFLYGFPKAMEYGCYPFIWGAIIKITLGGFLAFLIEKKLFNV